MAGDGHESSGAIAAAFAANMGIAATKFAGFIITGSSSLLAESIHSVADSSNQGLLFLGGRQAARKPDELHQFGYGRVRYFWAFVVSVVLFSLGGLFAVYEGYHKIHDPHELESAGIAIGILVVAFILEAFALRTAIKHATPQRGKRTWREYITQSRSPELPVLLLEDSGALIGLLCALLGVLMAVITGDPIWDGIGTLAIGLVLLAIAAVLAREMRSLLIGESASPELERRIDAELARAPEIVRVIHTLTEHIGPDEILIAAKVEFAPDLTTQQFVDAINAAEARVRALDGIGTARIYVEPDVGAAETVAEASAPKPE